MTVRDHVSGGGPVRAAAPHMRSPESEKKPVSGFERKAESESVTESEPKPVPEQPTEDAGAAALRRCRRCFLYEMDGKETYYQSVVRLRQAMPAAERADDAEYDRRLSVCRECPHLDNATCMQCGCYAEVRALKRDARCPMKRWQKGGNADDPH